MLERKVYRFRVDPTAKQELEDSRVYIPKIGWVAVRQSQAVDPTLKSATFKREATGKWHVSLVVEFDLPYHPRPAIETEMAVGVDVGFDRFATNSDDGVIGNPRFFRKAEGKIKRALADCPAAKKVARTGPKPVAYWPVRTKRLPTSAGTSLISSPLQSSKSGASVRSVTAGRSRRRKNPAASSGGSVNIVCFSRGGGEALRQAHLEMLRNVNRRHPYY